MDAYIFVSCFASVALCGSCAILDVKRATPIYLLETFAHLFETNQMIEDRQRAEYDLTQVSKLLYPHLSDLYDFQLA